MTNNSPFPFQDVTKYTLLASLFLLPILALPFTEQFIFDTKQYLLFATMLVVGFLYVGNVFTKKIISFAVTPITLPLALFGLAVIASTFFTGNYPVEHLVGIGGTYISAVVIALLAGSLIKDKNIVTWVVTALGLSGLILSLASISQFFGMGPSQLYSAIVPFDLPNNMLFNLSGSALVAAEILLVSLVGLVGLIMSGKSETLHKATAVIVALGLAVNVWALLPGQPASPVFLPFQASWSMSADIIKAPRTALIGVGPASFANAYNQFKPAFMNTTDNWNITFGQGSNVPFSLFVTTGLLGFAAWVFLAVRLFKQTKEVSSEGRPLHWMLLAIIAIQVLVPASPVLIAIMALLLGAWVANEQDRFMVIEIHGMAMRFVKKFNPQQHLTNHAKMVLYTFTGVLVIGLGFLTYAVGRSYAAQVKLYEGAKAALNNDGVSVYNNQREAVRLNPYLDTIRRRYALTNLTIAVALSQQQGEEEATPEQTQQVSQLIQQAIREGRAATLLDPTDSNNWQTAGQIYRALIGTAEGADQWTVTSYVNAIQTAPNNPNIRLALGGVLYGSQQFDQAAQIFQQAVNVKPDHANSYYNLANAFVQLGRIPDAKAAYQQALRFIDPSSEDYIVASEELSALDEQYPDEPEANTSAELGEPSITTQNTQTPDEVINQPVTGEQVPLESPEDVPSGEQPNAGAENGEAQASPTPTPAQPAPVEGSDL